MTRLLGLAVVLAACHGPEPMSPLQPTEDVVPADLVELREAFRAVGEDAAANGFAGVALVGVGERVEALVPFGVADREASRPVTADTAFLIGSITKQVTAALLLRLRDRGDVAFDVGVGAYLSELEGGAAGITIHQLLTHTSGLPESFGADDERLDQAGFLARVDGTALGRGGTYLYSNVGVTLAAVVAERITGMGYEAAVQSVLLEPAGIAELGTTSVEWPPEAVAVGYQDTTRWGTILDLPGVGDGQGYNLRGNGGLLATAAAIHQWTRALVDDTLLEAPSRAAMFTRHVRTDNGDVPVYAGYGWNLLDWPSGGQWPVATHSGSNGVFYAYTLRYLDEDVDLFVAVSTGETDGVFAVRAFRSLVNNWLSNERRP